MAKRITPGLQPASLRRRGVAQRLLACAMALFLVGCHPRDDTDKSAIESFGAAAEVQGDAKAGSQLQSSVDNVHATDHIETSTQESKDAGPGNTFVVLDVTVRNTGAQPEVFSEGKLVDVSAAGERTFATPVSMLTDEFLSLKVVPPSGYVRGKIAYEVPQDRTGVLYWSPGNNGQRILLNVAAPVGPPGMVGEADATASNRALDPVDVRGPATIARAADAPPRMENSGLEHSVAAIARSVVKDSVGSVAKVRSSTNGAAQDNDESARTLACRTLLSRNDPAQKAEHLGFFSRECPEFAMPPTWFSPTTARIAPTKTPGAGARWPPRPGPAFDCSQAWTRVEHLVCEDAVLSLMDWELARAYNQARRHVHDTDALQRDEDSWRHRIRDACDTSRCVEAAYDSRTAQLKAIAQSQ